MSGFDLTPFPTERNIVVDAGYLGVGRHLIHALLELDVTEALSRLEAAAGPGEGRLSLTGFLAASLGRTIAASPSVQALRDWRGRLVAFHEVDVVTMIEPSPGAVAVPHIIRRADGKTVRQISGEIRNVQRNPASSKQARGLAALGARLPRLVRLAYFWGLKKNPHWFKRQAGTTVITSVGMFGKGGGWGLGFLPLHTLGLTVGGIADKPGVHEGEISIRKSLNLTITFDHDVVDGAPAARFARALTDTIETARVISEADG